MAAVELINTTLYSDANLKAYYRLEGNSTDTKNAHNGTDTSMTYSSTSGQFGQYGSFDGTASKFLVADNTDMSLTTVGTWMFWLKPTNVSTNGTGCVYSQWIVNNYSLMFHQIDNSAAMRCVESPTFNNAGSAEFISTMTMTTNWNFIVYTKNGTTSKWYLNGSLTDTKTTMPSALYNSTAYFVFGQDGNADGFYNGKMDDFAIFNRELSATEISNHYSGADALGTSKFFQLF